MSGTVLVFVSALLIFAAARGEALLALSERAKRALGLLSLLALTGCLVKDACDSCHRDCGVLRDDCHAACDAMPVCATDAGDSDMSGVGGEDGAE
jgi:hypothetical protein